MVTESIPKNSMVQIMELGARVAAESGIATDCFHLGKLILYSLKTLPEWTLQIDAYTHESESSKSALLRSIRCARSMQRHGVTHGDIVALMAPNHNDLSIPFYAANYLGAAVLPLEPSSVIDEITIFFETAKPKIVFCQNQTVKNVETALNSNNIKAEIITFDASDKYKSFEDFMNETDTEDINVNDFRAADIDPDETLYCLMGTSGTTGPPKVVPLTHKRLVLGLTQWGLITGKSLQLSPMQWISGLMFYYMTALFGFTRVQTSGPSSNEHFLEIIRQYKPNHFHLATPFRISQILTHPQSDKHDFSCFDEINYGGCLGSDDFVTILRERIRPDTIVKEGYGMTEFGGAVFIHSGHPPKSLGRILPIFEGKTSPSELEKLIRQLPGVKDVAVVGILDAEYNDQPVACVVKKKGTDVTAQDIKNLVKNNMPEAKQLRGGVIFLEDFPWTCSMKIDRKKLLRLVQTFEKQ